MCIQECKQGKVELFKHTGKHAQKNNKQPGRGKSSSFLEALLSAQIFLDYFFKMENRNTHTPKGIEQTPRNILLQFYMGYFYRSVSLCGFHWEWNEYVMLLPWQPVSLWLAERYLGASTIPRKYKDSSYLTDAVKPTNLMAFVMQLTINKEIQIHSNIFSPSKHPCEGLSFLVKNWHIEKQEWALGRENRTWRNERVLKPWNYERTKPCHTYNCNSLHFICFISK